MFTPTHLAANPVSLDVEAATVQSAGQPKCTLRGDQLTTFENHTSTFIPPTKPCPKWRFSGHDEHNIWGWSKHLNYDVFIQSLGKKSPWRNVSIDLGTPQGIGGEYASFEMTPNGTDVRVVHYHGPEYGGQTNSLLIYLSFIFLYPS